MTDPLEMYILQYYTFDKLPANIRQTLGNSQTEWDKHVLEYSLFHQLRWKKNIVRKIVTSDLKYYEDLLKFSQQHLMMYPYHLSDIMVIKLRVTPFAYYHSIFTNMIRMEKSYDSLPNFSAADGVRLLGIGRNRYIEIMNESKAKDRLSKFLRKNKDPKLLLPTKPVYPDNLQYWWNVNIGFVSEEDVKACTPAEIIIINLLIDQKSTVVGVLEKKVVIDLFAKGLVYFGVPIGDRDRIVIPPLEGFVMNRVLGDYMEQLLYKVMIVMLNGDDTYYDVTILATMMSLFQLL